MRNPHRTQQPSQEFYNSQKIGLFGFYNKATKTQINFVLDKNEMIGKTPNGTLSLVFAGIKQINRGEKYLRLTCDNAVGQNKNNTTLQFLSYLTICGYYRSIRLSSMIAGHTKFKVDGNF